MIDLTPCANVLTYKTRFCPNCGTKNHQYASGENTTDDSGDGCSPELKVPSAGETDDPGDDCPPELKVPSAGESDDPGDDCPPGLKVPSAGETDDPRDDCPPGLKVPSAGESDDPGDDCPPGLKVPSAGETDDPGDDCPPELKVPSAVEEIKTDIASFKFDLKIKYGGIMSLAQSLSKYIESSKKVKVNVAVAGESGTGKSSFINAIRGLKHGDSSFAEVGFGDTTMEIKKYQHPKNKRIQLYDLPGYNTTKMTLQNLLKDLNLSDFDCCLLFFYPLPSPADKTFVQQLQTAGTKFCFVRTKLDEDFENGELDGMSKEEVLSKIKKKVDMSSDHFEELKKAVKFYISSDEPSVGEMNELISFIENQINPRKFEALLLSLPSLTEEVIQKKYQSLQKSAVLLAVRFAVFYPLFFKIEKNIKAEIEMYFQTFELNTTLEKNVKI
ncbi:unnamed protein product [Mytilus edulis]|uniref:IRG-type G domain-containing protein n=1 Tax=Mytilus edulis TaxID=6550 RepID=A0A8S3S232_MYTED|nr:unnamed protein product [Mytilus edulis]